MIIRGGGPSSGYVSTGFFSGKFPSCVENILFYFKIRSYIGSCHLIPHYGHGNVFFNSRIQQF
jgi:hypothetical protein